ncbi:MAG TPA: lipocalin-like domain-containing protein [Mycobacterium sp.]|nr:lipocalin-like domain-containing protein [Mycobacterium sp.]
MTVLRDAILGGWELSSFTSRDVDTGVVSYPLGRQPRGLILYTADGYMSAQLARRADGGGYIAYGGRFSVDEDTATLRHDVTMSMMPELLRAPQFRQVSIDGDRLTLSATAASDGVTTTHSTLIWDRI